MARAGRVCVATTLATTLVAGSAAAADATLGAGIDSAHVWRGVTLNSTPVLVPDLEVRGPKIRWATVVVRVRGFINIGDEGGLIPAAKLSKIDLEAGLSLPHGLALSYVEYSFPGQVGFVQIQDGEPTRKAYVSTREIALAWRPRGWIEPSLTVYRDVGEIDDMFVEAGLGRRFTLSENAHLNLATTGSYAGKRYALEYGGARGGFHSWDLHARLNYRPKPTLNLMLHAAYTRTFNESLPKQPVGFYGGVAVSVGY
jgi:hypothetical protein